MNLLLHKNPKLNDFANKIGLHNSHLRNFRTDIINRTVVIPLLPLQMYQPSDRANTLKEQLLMTALKNITESECS